MLIHVHPSVEEVYRVHGRLPHSLLPLVARGHEFCQLSTSNSELLRALFRRLDHPPDSNSFAASLTGRFDPLKLGTYSERTSLSPQPLCGP